MCGRTCLLMTPSELQSNCKYHSQTKVSKKPVPPRWEKKYNFGKQYKPSPNIAPTEITAVLISKAHISDTLADASDRVLVPMMWGIVPGWHRGDYTRHGFHTNNARLEGLLENRIYKKPFLAGQRCVVLAEGFYEWQTTAPGKTPFYVYAPQRVDGVKIEDRSTWTGPEDVNLLRMAGIFDVWTDDSGDQIWAYTVLTRESNDVLAWMHHRTPVILETEKAVQDWLDFEAVGPQRALQQLAPVIELCWHPVATTVNNSRNKSEQCNQPVCGRTIENNSMGKITNFFRGEDGPRQRTTTSIVKEEKLEPNEKRLKTEI